jgi:ADP-heptose:LPS heptosyltransferase
VLPSGRPVPGVERIAVLRANALGDTVVALPALEALRAAYPDARITLLGRQHHAALLCSRPSPVDDVVVLPDGAVGDERDALDATEREALLRDLAASGWDLAVQLHGGGRNSNRFVLRLGARVTVGSRTPDAPMLDRWVPYEHYQWEVARYLEVVGLVGAAPASIEPRVAVVDEDRAAVRRELPEAGAGAYAVLHPGATDPRRRWPVESFAEVGRELVRLGRRVIVTGVPAEHDLAERLVTLVGPRDAILADRLSLPALVGLLAAADLVVSNDTGPLHLGMAVGAPTVGVFWVGNLVNAGPLTRRRNRPLTSWRGSCPVCGRATTGERCAHDVSFVADVPPSAAIDAARSLLGLGP